MVDANNTWEKENADNIWAKARESIRQMKWTKGYAYEFKTTQDSGKRGLINHVSDHDPPCLNHCY